MQALVALDIQGMQHLDSRRAALCQGLFFNRHVVLMELWPLSRVSDIETVAELSSVKICFLIVTWYS